MRKKLHYTKFDLLKIWKEVSEVYHDRRGVKIFYGIDHTNSKTLFISLPGNFIESTVHFRDCPGDDCFLPELLEYYQVHNLLCSNKIAWRWFKKRAITFEFGDYPLSWYISEDGFTLDQSKLDL